MSEDRNADVEALRDMLGDVNRDVAAEILRLEPSPQELETALLWARGEGAVTGEQLTGKTAQLYDILVKQRGD